MKRAALLLGAVAVSLGGIATAVRAQVAPHDAHLWKTIAETAHYAMTKACGTNTTGTCSSVSKDGALTKMKAVAQAHFASCGTSVPCSWMKLAQVFGWGGPLPFGGYGTGGGGSAGGWDDYDCEDLVFSLDADGNLLVPSLNLQGGGPIQVGTMITSTAIVGVPNNVYTDSEKSGVLWAQHTFNKTRGGDIRAWTGCYAIQANGNYVCSSQAHWQGGTKKPSVSASVNPVSDFASWNTPTRNCPQSQQSAGGDFHFYIEGSISSGTCTWYAPNPTATAGKHGYLYGFVGAVPATQWDEWPGGEMMHPLFKHCPLSVEFIRRMTQDLLQAAQGQSGYPGPTNVPVAAEDVQVVNGDPPTVDDLDDTQLTDPGETDTPTPYPTPTPTPTPTSSAPSYDPSVSLGDPTAPEIDWWPDLPTLELAMGSPDCPTYSLTLMGWWDTPFILDTHCALIEQFRASISVLMIAMFAMMSLFIVFRA